MWQEHLVKFLLVLSVQVILKICYNCKSWEKKVISLLRCVSYVFTRGRLLRCIHIFSVNILFQSFCTLTSCWKSFKKQTDCKTLMAPASSILLVFLRPDLHEGTVRQQRKKNVRPWKNDSWQRALYYEFCFLFYSEIHIYISLLFAIFDYLLCCLRVTKSFRNKEENKTSKI